MLNKPVATAAAAVALLSAAVAPARAEPVKNIVLVHGAFADGFRMAARRRHSWQGRLYGQHRPRTVELRWRMTSPPPTASSTRLSPVRPCSSATAMAALSSPRPATTSHVVEPGLRRRLRTRRGRESYRPCSWAASLPQRTMPSAPTVDGYLLVFDQGEVPGGFCGRLAGR